MSKNELYLICAGTAFGLSFLLTPIVRALAIKIAMDTPSTAIKTHKTPTPLLGGVAMAMAFFLSLLLIRLFTHFPTGTLWNLRGMFIGGAIICLLGVIDDVRKPRGLGVAVKFVFQIAAAIALVLYGVSMHFIQPDYVSVILSVVWVVGVSNALNIIDIMDGFAGSQAAVAALGFLLIAMPSEAIYVNFSAAALIGAVLGFLPYNFSKRMKIFMGDSGALFLGFILAALSMGTRYDARHQLGVYAPLFILAIPIYDTFFVAYMRMRRGKSPFMGSKDHYALRLEAMGFSRGRIVLLSALVALVLVAFAWLVTILPVAWAVWIYIFAGGEFLLLSTIIAKIKMHDND